MTYVFFTNINRNQNVEQIFENAAVIVLTLCYLLWLNVACYDQKSPAMTCYGLLMNSYLNIAKIYKCKWCLN